MGQRFMPTEEFEAEVNGSRNRYLKGRTYTVHDTPQHRDLAKKLQTWVETGKAIIVGKTKGASRPATIKTGD